LYFVSWLLVIFANGYSMKVTYNWLKEFVNIALNPAKLAEELTMTGLEVVSLCRTKGDYVFEIEVTPNRSDCLSVLGIAREAAAISGKKIKKLPSSFVKKSYQHKQDFPFSIKIENKQDCPLYTARIIRDVTVGPSPAWLVRRLNAIGIRSVNNIVDITNYVLYETGEPLHAFDLDRLEGGEIVVRRAKRAEAIITIDGKRHQLNENILVIADAAKPVALAGVIGGADSEINESTKNILIEAAVFSPLLIRRTRIAVGVGTDSSYRFERGVDINSVCVASQRAAELILKVASGKEAGFVCVGETKRRGRTIVFNTQLPLRVLGVDIPPSKIKTILSSLGFGVKVKRKDTFLVKIPSFRQDMNIEADLIEEIARIYRYDNVPSQVPDFPPRIDERDLRDKKLQDKLRSVLISQGLNEVITFSLLNYKILGILKYPVEEARFILNPLNSEQRLLRPTLLAGLLDVIRINLNRKQEKVLIFEQGRRFTKATEETMLAFAVCGEDIKCLPQGRHKEEYSIFHIKGILEELFFAVGIGKYEFNAKTTLYFSEGSSFVVKLGDSELGVFGEIRPEILEAFDIKNKRVFAAEIQMEKIYQFFCLSRQYRPLPVYPAIKRDISLILKQDITAQQVKDVIIRNAGHNLKDVSVIDCYYGRQIPEGFKGIVFSCLYRSDDHTLTDTEVQGIHDNVLNALVRELQAKIR